MRSALLCERPEIHQIPVPNPLSAARATNAYLVRDSDDPANCLLVDTGMDDASGLEYLQAALEELGVDLGTLDVLLTHLHYDHSGLVDRLGFDGRLYLGRRELERWSGAARGDYVGHAGGICRQLGVSPEETRRVMDLVSESIRVPDLGAHETDILGAGDAIDVGDFRFEVLEFPGHTPCDIALYLPGERILLSGDVVIFDVTPAIALPSEGHDYLLEYLESLKRIQGLSVDMILPGHGVAQGSPEERVEWIAQHHARRLDRAERLIAENPGITGIQVIEGLHWNAPTRGDSEMVRRAHSMVVIAGASYLNALVDGRRVRRETGTDGIWRFDPR